MYYVEFIRKRSDVTWPEFQRVVAVAYKRWVDLHPEDAPVLAIGRTWRLGPREAQYIIVWKIPGLGRIDEWSDARRREVESAATIEGGTLSVADMDGGVYEDIGLEFV